MSESNRLIKLLLLLIFWAPSLAFAQNKHTLSGYVRDASNGEDLAGARVVTADGKSGALSNEYGFYSVTLPEGQYRITASYLGFKTDTFDVKLNQDVSHSFELSPEGIQVEEVKIVDQLEDENVTSLEMSTATINVEEVKRMPAFLGEVDVVRTIQLLPGVQGVGEGITGYYVRGGQASQNLIILDEATVFNASHVLGFFSVFNSDALRDDFKLYKGGIPARYSGRLASVLDLRMKEGNDKNYHAKGGIGLISSRLSLEGPIVKDKSSFMISGRRTYGDLFLLASKDENLRNTRAYFYDLNAKVNYKISDKDRLFLSGYFGRDVFKFRDQFANDWGNATATLRWNHLFSDKLFNNTTFIFSDFFYGFDASVFSGEQFSYSSGIRDYSLKSDFSWYANPKNKLRFGFNSTHHRFSPGLFVPIGESFLEPIESVPDYAFEGSVYVSNEQEINRRLSFEYGLAYSVFANIGPGTEYTYEEDGETVKDTLQYDSPRIIKSYGGIEPRLSARYIVDEFSSVKFSYNRMRQYLHLAGNSTASFPWDIWVPSSMHIPPQIADQIAGGYFRNFLDNKVETSIELYYKYMQNQIDFKTGAELLLNPRIETELLYGIGWSYGAEFLVRKKTGRLRGWVGYTLSRTQREIEGINKGNPYPATNDRRHDVSVVALYDLTPRVSLSATWVFATGNAVTFPIGKYIVDGQTISFYGSRNSSRMPDYHRMDLAVTVDGKEPEPGARRKLKSSWNFSLYNAYGRRNAWAIDFRAKEDDPTQTEAIKLYLFRWVPSVTWNFEF